MPKGMGYGNERKGKPMKIATTSGTKKKKMMDMPKTKRTRRAPGK